MAHIIWYDPYDMADLIWADEWICFNDACFTNRSTFRDRDAISPLRDDSDICG